MSTGILLAVLTVEVAVVGFGVLTLFVHAGWKAERRRRLGPDCATPEAWSASGWAMTKPFLPPPPGLAALPLHYALPALLELTNNVSGRGLIRLTEIADAASLVEGARRFCRSRRWWQRVRGIRLLARLGGAVDLVPALLDDGHPAGRAAAAGAAARTPTPVLVARLLHMLDDPDPLCRFGQDRTAGNRPRRRRPTSPLPERPRSTPPRGRAGSDARAVSGYDRTLVAQRCGPDKHAGGAGEAARGGSSRAPPGGDAVKHQGGLVDLVPYGDRQRRRGPLVHMPELVDRGRGQHTQESSR